MLASDGPRAKMEEDGGSVVWAWSGGRWSCEIGCHRRWTVAGLMHKQKRIFAPFYYHRNWHI